MPRLTINTAEAISFEPAEPGPYLMTIESVSEMRLSEEKKTPGVDVEFAFADPEISQRCGKIKRFYPIAGKGAGFFAELWKAVTGEEMPVGREGGDIDVDTDQLLNVTVMVEVANRPHKDDPNKIFNEAKKVVAAN